MARVVRDGEETGGDGKGEVDEEGSSAVLGGDKEDDPYDPQVWDELVYRFEEPNPMARWDSPLFTVPWEDAEPPCARIWEEVIEGKRGQVKTNLATVLVSGPRWPISSLRAVGAANYVTFN